MWILRASVAEGLCAPRASSRAGLGGGLIALVLGALFVAMVACLTITEADVRRSPVLESDRP